MDNRAVLLILMIVLIVFVVLLTVLGIIFIVALRKRRPVVKVVMAPLAVQQSSEIHAAPEETVYDAPPMEEAEAEEEAAIEEAEKEEDDDDDDAPAYVTEGSERVRYNRSFLAKLCQLNNPIKEWYSTLKNDILSYENVKDRISWKRENFRVGRMTFARFVVRGKTLCLLLAVEPISYEGTKYHVEDVSNKAGTIDTPTLYRIKSARRLKFAMEMIDGIMKELKVYKDPRYEAQDYFMPYEGDMALMQRGQVKRVVSGSTRTYKIEEVEGEKHL